MMYSSLLLCLLSFASCAYAMNYDEERRTINSAALTKEYAINNEDWTYEETSLEECLKSCGHEPATQEDQQAIRKDLILLGLNDPSIALYQQRIGVPTALVDYKQDNPLKAIWASRDSDKRRHDLAYLMLGSFIMLVKQNPSPEKEVGTLLEKAMRRSVKILLDNNDPRGSDFLAEWALQRVTSQLFYSSTAIPNYDGSFEFHKTPRFFISDVEEQRDRINTSIMPQDQKDALIKKLNKSLQNYLLADINNVRKMNLVLKKLQALSLEQSADR